MRVISAFLAFCLSAAAWNAVGHRAVAGLAYDLLSPAARARVDDILKRHPDIAMLMENGPADPAGRIRYAFMKAAVWPDIIKGDARFYDEARPDAVATPTQPGFPDMKRRLNWHYINVAFSTDGTEISPPPPVNVLSQLGIILDTLGKNVIEPGSGPAESDSVYLLPWALHLIGDVHQPMHCVTRYRKGQVNPATNKPWSDLGGNTIFVVGSYNLHAFWDDSLGITDTDDYVEGLIQYLSKQPVEAAGVLEPKQWVEEGFDIAKSFVYSFGNEGGSKENPIQLTPEYTAKAKEIARQRAALGARRMAAVLEARFGR